MWLVLLSILFTIIFFYKKSARAHKYWANAGVPHMSPIPLVGNLGAVVLHVRSFQQVIQEAYDNFSNNRYCGLYQFHKPALLVRCPNLIKTLTVREFEIFPEHRLLLPPEVDPLFSNNILTMRGGHRWHELRSTLTPSFTSSKLKSMFSLMKECAEQCTKHFENSRVPVAAEMKDVFSRYTNDLLGTVAFGVTCDSFKNPQNQFYLMGKSATNLTSWTTIKFFINSVSPILVKIFKLRIISKPVETFFRALIFDTLRLRENQNIVRPDMLNLLIEAQKAKGSVTVSEEDITSQAFIFFMAGFETSSTAMSFTAYELAVNQNIQKALQEEVDGICELSYEVLMGMKYLDMVISESLRKWPPVAFTDRQSVKPYTINFESPNEASLHLNKGTEIWIPIMCLHRDPKYYPNPDKFDPERFSDANRQFINHTTYLPFGTGPRNCIGSRFALLGVKLIIFYILKNFNIVPSEKTPIPLILDTGRYFPYAKGGFWLELKKRNKL